MFESYFQNEENSLDGLSELCDEYASGREYDMWQCNHGIGHGFMYMTGGDLTESIQLCSEHVPSGYAEYCQNGVYMEVFNSEVLAKENDFVNSDDPFETCRNQSAEKTHVTSMFLLTYLR